MKVYSKFLNNERKHLLVINMKVKVAQSCLALCDPMDYTVHGILQVRMLEWVAYSLLQGIFPTQGLNPGLLHYRQILHQLSHKGSSRILEWVAHPFSSGSSWPRNGTGFSWIASGFFTNWAIREALNPSDQYMNQLLKKIYFISTHRKSSYEDRGWYKQQLLEITCMGPCGGWVPSGLGALPAHPCPRLCPLEEIQEARQRPEHRWVTEDSMPLWPASGSPIQIFIFLTRGLCIRRLVFYCPS